jgi:serine/threonine-protein kinase RsbW
MLDRQPLGFITLAFSEPPRIGEEERALLVAAARQAAQALERAWLHEQTRGAARRSGLLAEVSHALNQAQSLTDRAHVLVEYVVPDVADAACVEILGEEGPRTIAVAAVDDAARKGILGLGRVDAGATVLPLRARGRLVGSLILSAAQVRSELRDESLLGELAARAALALENARLYEREHRIAHAMQRSLLAGEPPRDPRFAVATRYQAGVEALEVGGDWYDAFAIGSGRLGVVVGDVVGRGLEAASAMGQLRSALRALTGAEASPGALLDRLEQFVEHFDVGRAATVALADIELETGTMRYACAGHPPPVLIQPGAPPQLLWDGRSPPLGAFPALRSRSEAQVRLLPGARLVLYTDGLIERRGRAMDDGLAELVGELGRRGSATPQQLVDELAVALDDPEGATDDVCLLCLAFGPR